MAWYATSVFYDPNRWPYRIERFLPQETAHKVNREFKRRYAPYLDPAKVRQFGKWEWIETGLGRLGARRSATWANDRGNTAFGQSVIKLIEREPIDIVWGFDSASLEVFRWAKKWGLFCVLDQTSGYLPHINRVTEQEFERNPEFFHERPVLVAQDRIERQAEELALADLVVVGSASCARFMIDGGCAPEKVRVVAYGFDAALFPAEPPSRQPLGDRPIDFLFVGGVRPAKGIAYLLKAIAQVPPAAASLTLLGGMHVPKAAFAPYADRVNYCPFVPRPEVVRYFRSADCFIFPSLLEGSALVLKEAIGTGLGIVQTAASGDGAREGTNGIIIPEISVEAVGKAIETVLARPPELIAWQKASWDMRPEHTWQAYRQRLRDLPIF